MGARKTFTNLGDEKLFQRVKTVYEHKNLGKQKLCRECRKDCEEKRASVKSDPVGPWYIGSKFKQDRYKILFVGKTGRGDVGDLDGRKLGRKLFLTYETNFWAYMREITCRLYGVPLEEAIEHIAITNLLKCNSSTEGAGTNSDGSYYDQATTVMKTNCIEKLGVFWEELRILKPRHVVLFTGRTYDSYIKDFPDFPLIRTFRGKDWKISLKLAGKEMKSVWWTAERGSNGFRLRTLRTYHPQYFLNGEALKKEFAVRVLRWVKRHDQTAVHHVRTRL